MKKLLILSFAFFAIIGFNACSSEDDVVFVAQPDPEGISFTCSFSSSYLLTQTTLENTAERFVWNTVDYEVPTNEIYELQGSIDPEFNSFSLLGTTGENNVAITVQQLWDLAADAGLDNDPTTTDMPNSGQLYFRVVASAGTEGGMAVTSEVQALTVVILEAAEEEEPALPNFFLVGDATAPGWDPNNNNTPLFRDPENPAIFYFTGRFAGGAEVEGFKLLETTEWQPQWGLDNGSLSNSTLLGADPTAFPVTTDAYFTFTINMDEMTYTFEEYDASGVATYETIGFLGSATLGLYDTGADGWGADVDFTQSVFNPHVWYANNIELINGDIKFRAADAWDISWGTDSGALSDQTTPGGPNIPVTAGFYDIWFNDLDGRYILIPQVVVE